MNERWNRTNEFTELDFMEDKWRFEKKHGKKVKYIFEGMKVMKNGYS